MSGENPQLIKKILNEDFENYRAVLYLKIFRMMCKEIGTTPNGRIIYGTIELKHLTVYTFIFSLSIFAW